MTTIVIRKTDTGEIRNFVCQGHSGYGFFFQKDVVCASVSVLVINTVNALEEIAKEPIEVVSNETEGLIFCAFKNDTLNEKSKVLMDAMVLGIDAISKEYGEKYLKLKFEEV